MSADTAPIGVFDSGMGGLTVLRALQAAMPGESFIYLGDTARLPYGSKSPRTVARYAEQAAHILVDRGIRALVVACNTASAFALPLLEQRFPGLPLFGVVEPGATAAAAAASGGSVLVLATESTVAGGAYQRAILGRRADLKIHARPCPLLVALAEEGEHEGAFCESVLRHYLHGHIDANDRSGSISEPAAIVLGCTHFPVFRAALNALFNGSLNDRAYGRSERGEICIVDSAETTARVVSGALGSEASAGRGNLELLATDGPERFMRVGRHFLGNPIDDVELVDL